MDTIIRQLRGKRKSGTTSEVALKNADGTEAIPKDTISVSQQSYDHQVAQFRQLVALLNAFGFYQTNEPDLSFASLQSRLDNMTNANTAVTRSYAALESARALRNSILYAPNTGLVATANAVKDYVKGAFGTKGPEYTMIKGLSFRSRSLE